MSVFAISDLHLSLGTSKAMDVFGGEWDGYVEKLEKNWNNCVDHGDLVIVPGDLSWATYLDETTEDFKFLDKLKGKKLIVKGNHDYWWTSSSKMQLFLKENNFESINFISNNYYREGKYLICGTRGWKCPSENDFTGEDKKLYERELIRIEISFKEIQKVRNKDDILIAAFHFPPTNARFENREFIELFNKYGVNICLYGHLHGKGFEKSFEGIFEGIRYSFVSADYLKFVPTKIF